MPIDIRTLHLDPRAVRHGESGIEPDVRRATASLRLHDAEHDLRASRHSGAAAIITCSRRSPKRRRENSILLPERPREPGVAALHRLGCHPKPVVGVLDAGQDRICLALVRPPYPDPVVVLHADRREVVLVHGHDEPGRLQGVVDVSSERTEDFEEGDDGSDMAGGSVPSLAWPLGRRSPQSRLRWRSRSLLQDDEPGQPLTSILASSSPPRGPPAQGLRLGLRPSAGATRVTACLATSECRFSHAQPERGGSAWESNPPRDERAPRHRF